MMFPGPDLPPNATRAEKRAHDHAFAAWVEAETSRIKAQRAAFAKAFGPKSDVQEMMIARAWELLDAGEAEAADALLEFVPEWITRNLLDEFFLED